MGAVRVKFIECPKGRKKAPKEPRENPPPIKLKRARCSSQDRLKKAPRYLVWYRCKLKIARVSEHAPFEPHLRLAATLLVIKITYMKTARLSCKEFAENGTNTKENARHSGQDKGRSVIGG